MRLLLDLNLSPDLCKLFSAAGHEAIHWSSVGELTAPDDVLMAYAAQNDLIVVTHDLGFSALLASTRANAPSIVQVRTQDVLTRSFVDLIAAALKRFEAELTAGALVVIDESRSRVRILPIDRT